ncbi:gamma-glutamyl-phosphate reductase, partial [bacterium]|nr:gamma-glutamyl-phosphate reductase [bacterium]
MNFLEIAKSAKLASLEIAGLSEDIRNQALISIANILEDHKNEIFEANKLDLENARILVESGKLSQQTFNRLKLDENKMRDMIQGIRDVAKLPDPINKILFKRELDKDLVLTKITCPIGVLGIIFEARPDVISQISSLAIKSGNAVILKGGKESVNTNKTILSLINSALDNVKNFPKNVLSQVFTHEDIAEMLKCDEFINLIIPRGGNKLV